MAGVVLMVCTTLKARGVKEASVLNLGSLHADLPKPSSQTGEPSNTLPPGQVKYTVSSIYTPFAHLQRMPCLQSRGNA